MRRRPLFALLPVLMLVATHGVHALLLPPSESFGPAASALTPPAAATPFAVQYDAGMQALQKGDTTAAERAFREAMRLDPASPLPLIGLADVDLLRKQPSDAKAWLEKAAKLAPTDARPLHALGSYHRGQRAYAKAEAALKHAVALDSRNLRAQLALADLYSNELKRPDLAAAVYRTAIGIDPNHGGARHGLGMSLALQGKPSEAEAAFREAARLAPDNPLPLHALGRLHAGQGKLPKALDAFNKALAIKADFVPSLLDRGDILLAKGDANAALEDYQRAAEVSPKYDVAQIKLGIACQALNRRSDAEQAYLAALKLNPTLALAYNNLAWMATQDATRHKQAIAWAEKAVNLAPGEAEFLDTLGWAYYRAGRLEQAKATLQKAVAAGTRSADPHYHLGKVWEALGHRQEARKAFLKALSIQKNHTDAQAALARLN